MCYKSNFRLDGNVLIVQVKRENTVFEISLENHWKMLPSVMKMLGKRPMPKNSEVTGSIILSSTSVNKKDLLITPDPKDKRAGFENIAASWAARVRFVPPAA